MPSEHSLTVYNEGYFTAEHDMFTGQWSERVYLSNITNELTSSTLFEIATSTCEQTVPLKNVNVESNLLKS